jgi:phosphoglycerate dehydrogenase-like enzyme
MARISADIIAGGSFGLIQQFGVGLETVDVDAATQAGVWVARIPSGTTGNADSVAEHAVLLVLALSRNLAGARAALDAGMLGEPAGRALVGKTACIVGLGDVGIAVATRLAAFGMRLTAVRKHPERGAPAEARIAQVLAPDALREALSPADYVILCVNYEPALRHMIDAAALEAVKPGAFIINVARGGLIDPLALEAALRSGRLAGAGLDVFWEEPAPARHPIFRLNVIATPHVAGVTDVSYAGIARLFAHNVLRYAAGQPPHHAVNRPARAARNARAKAAGLPRLDA